MADDAEKAGQSRPAGGRTSADVLADLLVEQRALVAQTRKLVTLLTPPAGWRIVDRQTSTDWQNIDLPPHTALWVMQNQSVGEAVRWSHDKMQSGATYGLIYPQGSISRGTSPITIWFRRDSSGSNPPTIILEAWYWTEDQLKGHDIVRTMVQRKALGEKPGV